MFNRKKVTKLKAELAQERKDKDLLCKVASYLQKLINEKETILSRINGIDQKITSTPVPKYDVSAVEFAQKLQKLPKKKSCGTAGCGFFYSIPAHIIDEVAIIKHIDRQ